MAGCATTEQRSAHRAQYAETIPKCTEARECEVKWSAARRFVNTHSAKKLQMLTNDYMETYGPGNAEPGLSWRVSKEPAGSGYRFVAEAWCANIFGCQPDALKTMVEFNSFVDAAQ